MIERQLGVVHQGYALGQRQVGSYSHRQRDLCMCERNNMALCTALVKQLAKKAKRRSKIFYRRVTHALLTPPTPSMLPVPSQKIQRILQRNNPWSNDAIDHIPQSPTMADVPPPPPQRPRAPRTCTSGPEEIH